MKLSNTIYFCFLSLFAVIAFTASSAHAQSSHRDYMTDAEIELVRDAQDIDARIAVLTKMIDRRFAVLKLDVGGAAIPNKETDKWGPTPEGTRMDILDDIRKLLDKAVDDIDDTAMHPNKYIVDPKRSDKQKQIDEARFPKSVKNLAASAKRYQPALKSLLDKTTDEKEKGLILAAIDSCDEIIAATTKLPAETKKN
jgi:hypothetical protein